MLEDQVGELWASNRELKACDMKALVDVSLCPCELSLVALLEICMNFIGELFRYGNYEGEGECGSGEGEGGAGQG